MRIHDALIIISVLVLITLGMVTFVTDVGETYNQTANTDTFNNLTAKFTDVTEDTNKLENQIANLSAKKDVVGALSLPFNLFSIGVSMIKVLWSPFVVMQELIEWSTYALAEQGIPVPKYAVQIMWIIIIATFIFIIIGALWKWRLSDD